MKVSKTIKWEAAHRLVHGYPGNCAHCHGHSYVATIVLKSEGELDQYGFVKDFNDFKQLRQWVDQNWDHGTLVSSDDQEWIDWLQANKQRHFVVKHNPTAETIGKLLFRQAARMLNDDRGRVCEVRVQETSTSEAVITQNDFSADETQAMYSLAEAGRV